MFILAVAIKTPLYKTFDYQSDTEVKVGCRVRVNFAGRKVVAIVVQIKKQSEFTLKNILEVIDKEPIINQTSLDLIRWCSNYYCQPIGEVAFASIPKNLRIGKEVVVKKKVEVLQQKHPNITLNDEQHNAINTVTKSLHNYDAFLLHGITGSGKTEVYLQIATQVLQQHKQVLVLVPEIGLTPQMVHRFASRLNTKVVVIHSNLNQTQKLSGWTQAKNGECGVVLGTRSAIWTQLPNLGLIIIDEEHDTSFKQQSMPRYNAKNIAFMRAKHTNIPIILGSATPSVESLKLLIDKKITHLLLTSRASGSLPTTTIASMAGEDAIISHALQQKITTHLQNNKQVMIFINRRGYAPVYHCTSCGWRADCKSCEKPFIYHRDSHILKCHSCENTIHPPQSCPNCNAHTLQVVGYGTQRLEEHLSSLFHNIDIIRIDRDSTTKKSEFEHKLNKIKTGKPMIIVGTQMLAKGHDFPNITLVGVLDSDNSLLSTQFRATEYLAQLLIQVSGRAGRANENGEVVIQTRFADYPIFNFIKHHNYAGFIKGLLTERKSALMPPFSYNALICANSKTEEKAKHYLGQCKKVLEAIQIDGVRIFTVIAATPPKKANYYYFHLNLYSEDRIKLGKILHTFLQHIPKQEFGVRYFIDVDPLD
jgi:primosomal protein N' (replication factor Y)